MWHLDRPSGADVLVREAATMRALGRRLLGGNAADADDLAQDACLAALQQPAPAGPLAAWLRGIARRLAALARRREARRAARERRHARAPHTASAADAAAGAELLRIVADAVHALPEPYRTTVVLRFWHDLPPRRIAARLAVPVATVRSRLQRSFAMLRERLDTTCGERVRRAAPLAAWLRPHAAAAAGPGGSLAALLGGGIAMATKWKLLAAVLLAGGALVVLGLPGSPAAPPATPATSDDAIAAASGATVRSEAGIAADGTRAARAVVATEFRGRCIRAEDGTPLAGCRVALVAVAPRDTPRQTPRETATDAGGRFRIALAGDAAVAGATAARLVVLPQDRVALHRRLGNAGAAVVELGDVAVPPGAAVHGLVVDAEGAPVGDVAITVMPRQSIARADGFELALPPLWSSGDGVLHAAGRLAAGRWRPEVASSEHVLVSPEEFVVEPEQRELALRIVVARLADRPAIRGTLVDEAGMPVAGVRLRTGTGDGDATTAADGTFAIHRRGSGDGKEPTVLVLAPGEAFTLREPSRRYAWTSEAHRVVVVRPTGLVLRVVADDDGEPVTRYGVRLLPLDRPERTVGRQHRGEHANGLLHLRDVPVGRHRLLVYPEDPELMPGEPLDVDIGPAGAMAAVRLERARPLHVTLRTARGEPVSGSHVELFRQEGDGTLGPYSNIGSDDFVHDVVVLLQAPAFVVLSTATTGADGRAVLHGPGRGRLGLRVQGRHVTLLHAPVDLPPGGGALDLVVERGAALHGIVAPPALLAQLRPDAAHWRRTSGEGAFADPARPWPTLQLRRQGGDRLVLPHRTLMEQPGFAIGDDGSCRIEGIPAGSWSVELQFGVGGAWYQRTVVESLPLRDGETRELAIDVAGLAPVTLQARLLRDGEPFANAHVRLGNATCRADARGVFTAVVPGGSYRLAAAVDLQQADASLWSDGEILLAPGQRAPDVIALTHRRLRVRVLRADGSPAAGIAFGVTGRSGRLRTDDAGFVVLDPAPPVAVWLSCADPPLRLGPVQMPLERREAELVLTLPR